MAEEALQPAGRLRLVNVWVEAACALIAEHHSQLPRCNCRGLLFAIGAGLGARLVAVAIAGAPTGQWRRERVNPRDVLELTRVASDRTAKNASSLLVARLVDRLQVSGRVGEGPALFVTYSLAGEAGTPYRALADKGLRPVAQVKGQAPSGARRGSVEGLAESPKVRWEAGERALPARWDPVA
jgi:hypothetical protein